jgi:hypothetical protein
MSTRALIRAIQHLFSNTSRLAQRITKKIVTGFLRNLLLVGRRPRMSRAGFVLPTTVLLLLVATLTIGSITYRTYTRTAQTIGDRQQRVIYNAATPAIDRARAKLEFLFDVRKDPRFPGGIPGEGRLVGMLLNDGSNGVQELPGDNGEDVYTLPGEDRIDINGDGRDDNAWSYRVDTDEDNVLDATVVYSILFEIPATFRDASNNETPLLTDSSSAAIAERANKLQVRQGPLSSILPSAACRLNATATQPEAGWIPDGSSTSTLRKNFQIDAFVLPDAPTGTVATLEFYQDRQVERGNKWGAWFRNDLEIFPAPNFNWNGAMHTEGSLIVGKPSSGLYTSYMISSHNSCLYSSEKASEVTVAEIPDDVDSNDDGVIDIPAFRGQIISGLIGKNNFSGNSRFHLFDGPGVRPIYNGDDTVLEPDTDSVGNGGGSTGYALDPVILLTEGVSVSRNGDNSILPQEGDWQNSAFKEKKRIFNESAEAPSVDDSFRADDRYGPRPRYQNKKIPVTVASIGEVIDGDKMIDADLPDEALTRNSTDDDVEPGLDGYWERRAWRDGLRLIVGQRLELGLISPKTWGYIPSSESPRSPLRPWNIASQTCGILDGNARCNEARQRRTLVDNLAAVQATAVYHSIGGSRDFPLACIATTTHPGTSITLDRSATFENLIFGADFAGTSPPPLAVSDFFSGRGTNGWEYSAPSETGFPGTELTKALQNLAHFAGDPNGGAPSFPPVQDGTVHPYPLLSMWGDFSMLRRILNPIGGSFNYSALSPADKTYLHTAACTLGMLAHNVDYLEKAFSVAGYAVSSPGAPLSTLARLLTSLNSSGLLGVRVANTLPAEVQIEGLKRARNSPTATAAQRREIDEVLPLAQLVMQKEQVEHDRLNGFFFNPDSCRDLRTASAGLGALCPQGFKYPILYSLFPLSPDPSIPGRTIPGEHPEDPNTREKGNVLERADSTSTYITNSNVNGSYRYQGVDVAQIALSPQPIGGTWRTPNRRDGAGTTANSNRGARIKVCGDGRVLCDRSASNTGEFVTGDLYQVAFKDSGMFNSREMMSVRVLDINLDLLRRAPIAGDFWLPESGIVYAFREDAVSENSIVRPALAGPGGVCASNAGYEPANTACHMQVGQTSALNSTDPPLSDSLSISPKPVDYYPDPDRRPHGFRLREGSQLSRGGTLNRGTDDRGRGLSFITDNPVYIQGDFNLHQTEGNALIEEFTQTLFVRPRQANQTYTPEEFYNERRTPDPRFADPTLDQWRPTEILADAVTILSNNFCDGSIEDGFLTAGLENPTGANLSTRLRDERPGAGVSLVLNGSVYGCVTGTGTTVETNPITSYLNQNRPNQDPGLSEDVNTRTGVNGGMYANRMRWTRENWYDRGAPVAVSRNGNPIKNRDTFLTSPTSSSPVAGEYSRGSASANESYYPTNLVRRPRIAALSGTRVNSIIISGIVPSRENQSYGGMHNFPRFLEDWARNPLYISGSFLQLNFSNYATGPFDQDAFEVGIAPLNDDLPNPNSPGFSNGELIRYYEPPSRLWGYDVGLQYAPAGPLAQRFVTFTSVRSEFYNEPPANDPYIVNLCNAIAPNRCPD